MEPRGTAKPLSGRWRVLRYLATFTLPLGAWATFTDRHGWYWMVPLFGFVLIPILELLLRGRPNDLSEEEEQAVLSDPLFDLLLYAIVPVQYVLLFLFLQRVQAGGLETGDLLGCVPLYVKSNSYGEYVFDHGWADAFERAGGSYYDPVGDG